VVNSGERRTEDLSSATSARLERRYVPLDTTRARSALGLGLGGAAALGAAVYGSWLAELPMRGAGVAWVAALLLLCAAPLLASRRPPSITVGDLGVSFGEPNEASRLPWCDIQSIRLSDESMTVATASAEHRVVLPAHAFAAARIVREASLRIGARVDISPRAHERLPNLERDTAMVVAAPRLQVAGRRCRASGEPITFEADARWCATCAALYHARHLPKECAACGRPPELPLGA
jgi:hypothetical protein